MYLVDIFIHRNRFLVIFLLFSLVFRSLPRVSEAEVCGNIELNFSFAIAEYSIPYFICNFKEDCRFNSNRYYIESITSHVAQK